jgi:hypothetical protein
VSKITSVKDLVFTLGYFMGSSIVLNILLPPSPLIRREYRGGEGGRSDLVGEEHCSGPNFRTTELEERRRKRFVGVWKESEVLLCSRMGGKSEHSSDGNSP